MPRYVKEEGRQGSEICLGAADDSKSVLACEGSIWFRKPGSSIEVVGVPIISKWARNRHWQADGWSIACLRSTTAGDHGSFKSTVINLWADWPGPVAFNTLLNNGSGIKDLWIKDLFFWQISAPFWMLVRMRYAFFQC